MAKVIDLVVECMNEKGMTQTELANSLGEDVRVINQQLNRQQDLKAERFLEVMEHIGFRVEIVDNDGIRKIDESIVEGMTPATVKGDKFYAEKNDGSIVGVYLKDGMYQIEEFGNKADCFDWLISFA